MGAVEMADNLFDNLPDRASEELVTLLAVGDQVRVERIVSNGHNSPEDFWYDQEEHEWVVVLAGEAKLRFQDQAEAMRMSPGDYVQIPAHRKHRVEWTTPVEPTVWLAVFYRTSAFESAK